MNAIPSWAVPGAKVVCVDDCIGPLVRPTASLVAGEVYEIEFILSDELGVFVDLTDGGKQWRVSRFRPAVSRSQDQDIAEYFRHHLDQRVDA